MLLAGHRLRHHGTYGAGTKEPGERCDGMNDKESPERAFHHVPESLALVSRISNSPWKGALSCPNRGLGVPTDTITRNNVKTIVTPLSHEFSFLGGSIL